MLEMGADVCAQDGAGATPLIHAAYWGHTNVIHQLLSSQQGAQLGEWKDRVARRRMERGEAAPDG